MMFQPIERFPIHQTPFSTIIQRSKHPLFTYGIVTILPQRKTCLSNQSSFMNYCR